MTETTVQSNNKLVSYRSKPQREKPRMSGLAVASQTSEGRGDSRDDDQGDTRMPWTAKSFKQKHNKKASPSAAKAGARQATAMVNSGVDEGIAIATANKRINKLMGKGSISSGARERMGSRYAGHDQQPIDASSR